jgi:hypothetical protein
MWPFQTKPKVQPSDPYSDYLDCDQFISSQQLSADERYLVQRGLSAFAGQRLHPEIARDMFGAFSASALASHAFDLARDAEDDPNLFAPAISALQKAHSIYPHPVLLSHLADIFEITGRPSDAEVLRRDAELLQSHRSPKDTDQLLITNLAFRL